MLKLYNHLETGLLYFVPPPKPSECITKHPPWDLPCNKTGLSRTERHKHYIREN